MSDSESDDECEAAEFMSQPEIRDFLEEAEGEKELPFQFYYQLWNLLFLHVNVHFVL